MKPLWKGLTAAALAACLCATGVLAAGHHGQGLRYTDADGDGICDYYGIGCGSFTDADGDGICDRHGTACSGCFVDTDGDGICDYYGAGLGVHRGGGHHGNCRNH